MDFWILDFWISGFLDFLDFWRYLWNEKSYRRSAGVKTTGISGAFKIFQTKKHHENKLLDFVFLEFGFLDFFWISFQILLFWAISGFPEADFHSPKLPLVIYHARVVTHMHLNTFSVGQTNTNTNTNNFSFNQNHPRRPQTPLFPI